MGDEIELTTWPKHKNIFYKVTSSAISFDVKASGNAAVGLAQEVGTQCQFWIVIGHSQRCWIKKRNNSTESATTPNILSTEEYKRFWISWNEDCVCLGQHGEQKPIIQYFSGLPDLKYITFCVQGERNPVHWKFELPPILHRPLLKPIKSGKMQWLPADTQLPDDALIGGYEKEFLYIIRANHRGSLTPGKFVPSEGLGYISWGGGAHDKGEFEVLCGIDCVWVQTKADRIPAGAIEAGYSEVNRETLYVGRVLHDGHVIPGKVQPSHRVCYIPYKDTEKASKNYEILTAPEINAQSAHPVLLPHIDVDIDVDVDDENSYYHQSDDDDDNVEYDDNHPQNLFFL